VTSSVIASARLARAVEIPDIPRVTLQSVLQELEQTLRDARADGAWSACVQALALVTKIVEMLENQRVSHGYAHLDTPEAVCQHVREQYGERTALLFAQMMEGDDTVIEVEAEPADAVTNAATRLTTDAAD
jgi:hypothetical protein